MELQDLKDKKIVFFVAETPPSLSGSGIMAFHLAEYLSRYASSVRMISFNYNNTLSGKEKKHQLEIKRINYYNSNILTKILSFPGLLFQYLRESNKQDICFIYGNYMPGYEIIMASNIIYKIKTIFVSTLLDDDDFASIIKRSFFPLKRIRKYLFSRITLYWAINEEFETIWQKQFKHSPPVILSSQGINTDTFFPLSEVGKIELRNKYQYPKDVLILLSVGFLIERKGYNHIFEALAHLNIPFLYLIAGSKSAHAYHRSSIREKEEMQYLHELGRKKLGEQVIFLGQCTEMHSIYSVADILLHGADREGTPNVVLEAMACGKPVIMKQLTGLDYIIKDNINALIYKQNDELVSKISRLANDSKLAARLSENAHRTIMEQHTIHQVANKIVNIDGVPT